MITAALEGGRIMIQVEPTHFAACCRVPGGRYNASRRAWTYPATPETAANLVRTFPELQPVDLLDQVKNKIAAAARASEAQTATSAPQKSTTQLGSWSTTTLAPVSAGVTVEVPEVPAVIKTRPWRHQLLAFGFIFQSFAIHLGGAMLAMRMGTGKSLVALMCIAHGSCKIILIICPRRVIGVWKKQFADNYGGPVVLALLDNSHGSVVDRVEHAGARMELARITGVPFVVVVNFDVIYRSSFAKWSLGISWDLVIVDESHRAKAPGGRASLLLKALRTRSRRRLMLTGTPMPHSPLDIYAQARFLDARIFGNSYIEFRRRYAEMGGFKGKQIVKYKNLDEITAKLFTLVYRVDESVLDLPGEVEVFYECELGEDAKRAYDELEQEMITEIDSGVVTAANAMVRLLRLQQITGGALRADESDRYDRIDNAKIELLADVIEDLGPDEPWVCFCRFHADLDAVHMAAAEAALKFGRKDYECLELSGRKDELERWQRGEGIGLAVQTSAGGVGVDLTRACYSIFYSLSFNLAEYEQALKRTHRPGQTRSVTHIHLVATGTVDIRVYRALEKRAAVIESVLSELQGLAKAS